MTAESRLEASRIFTVNNSQVAAGFRTREEEVLAGGPLRVEFFVESDASTPLYLAVGTDRARLRPADFFFSATTDKREINLKDPAAGIADLGGLGSVVEIKRGAPHRQTILVNEFLGLEDLAVALRPGEVDRLQLRCQRSLQLAASIEEESKVDWQRQVVSVTLAIGVKRDDVSLKSLIAGLAARLNANRDATVSAERELAVAELVALRSPLALPYLRSLSDHPDPAVQMYVTRGMALMTKETDSDV
jgi:hypothetical protein